MSENENKATEANEEIQDPTLEDLSGGYVYNAGAGTGRQDNWEVIDPFGFVVGRYSSVREAEAAARELGLSDRVITWRGELEKLRRGEPMGF